MHHKRNQRIEQVTENTLIIGVDIAKESHYACAVDHRSRELGKSWKFSQSRNGFETFLSSLLALQRRHEKTDILIGLEPTGHYWMNLAVFLTEQDIPFVLVNPLHVKRSKELDDNLQSKNDPKDARLIAKMITYGHYSVPRHATEVETELRRGAAYRARLKKDLGSIKNRIQRWLDLYFPEFRQVFKDILIQAKAILDYVPLPVDICQFSSEEMRQTLRDRGVRCLPKKKVAQLREHAAASIGVQDSPKAARREIHSLLHQQALLEEDLDTLTEDLIEEAKKLPDFLFLTSIKGVSDIFVAELLAETGSLLHYKHPRQLHKLAGLTLRTNSSGKHEGEKHLSKRGRKRLRALLYKAILPLIRNNQGFHQLFLYYKTRRENPLKGKEAMVILCRKLLQICHGLSGKKRYFESHQMIEDMSFLPLKKTA